MFTRDDIRYHTLWVRVVCCLAVGVGVANGVYAGLFVLPEQLVRDLLVYSEAHHFTYLPRSREILWVLVLSVLPAPPRIERPLSMVAFGAGLVAGYVALVLASVTFGHVVLPPVAPLLAMLGAATVLETMAWSEERSRRRRLEGLETARQQFVDMLVHDLRKRAATVQMACAALETNGPAGPRAAEWLSALHAATDRMMTLISSLLDVRRIQEGSFALKRERASLKAVAEDAAREQGPAAQVAGVRLSVSGRGEALVLVDTQVFARLLTNLLSNALQHAPAGTQIEIEYGADASGAFLSVGNRGPVIPPERRASVFRPFGQAASAATSSASGGTGLGLAFCKLAAEAHGGTIDLRSPWEPHGDGVWVCVRLPRSAALPPRNVA